VDTALLVVTILSLAAALVSVLAVQRMKHVDQQRSDARVAALAAAASAPIDDVPLFPQPHAVVNRPSLIVDRPSAPVQRPSSQVERAPGLPAGRSMFGASFSPVEAEAPLDDRGASTRESFFGAVQRETPASGRFAFVAAAAMLVALGGAVVVFTTSGHNKAGASAAAAARAPLELVSLGHTREDSMLTISGMVRNPAGGPKLEGLTAVVSLIDTHGGLISTKDVPLDYRALGPGEEAPFKVTVPDSGSVARYRVSFRAGTDVVPHVDRRSDTKLASTL
jgi:hypothetical protein